MSTLQETSSLSCGRFFNCQDSNEIIAINLKPFRWVHSFHIIKHATTCSQVSVIPGKRKDIIINSVSIGLHFSVVHQDSLAIMVENLIMNCLETYLNC